LHFFSFLSPFSFSPFSYRNSCDSPH
jgi:hypothetical protein